MMPELKRALAGIRLVIMDVDGVMTNGQLILGAREEMKAFHVQDGLGVTLLRKHGIQTGIITGRQSDVVARRAEELKIDFLVQGAMDKRQAFDEMLQSAGVEAHECCFIGDDLIDLPLIVRCGVGVAVANARNEVKAQADLVTAARGGEGAVRELCELILTAKSLWPDIITDFLS